MTRIPTLSTACALTLLMTACANNTSSPETVQAHVGSEDIDFPAFVDLSSEVMALRNQRLLDVVDFMDMANRPDVILLDTRSQTAYEEMHLAGAVHLNFSDFTEEKLAEIIPSPDTPILIYCNNNFEDDRAPFPLKSAPLALNIPTFVNLVGYGYTEVYELENLLALNDSRLQFEGSMANTRSLNDLME